MPARVKSPPMPCHFQPTIQPIHITSIANSSIATGNGCVNGFGSPSPMAIVNIKAANKPLYILVVQQIPIAKYFLRFTIPFILILPIITNIYTVNI